MTKMQLVKQYVRDYIKHNNIKGDDIRRLYNEAWEVCQESVSCTKSMFIMYMMD